MTKCLSPDSSHLDVLVTVGTVVNDGERLLETGTSDADDISNQLTDSDDHLDKYRGRLQEITTALKHDLQEHG